MFVLKEDHNLLILRAEFWSMPLQCHPGLTQCHIFAVEEILNVTSPTAFIFQMRKTGTQGDKMTLPWSHSWLVTKLGKSVHTDLFTN